MIWPAEDLWLAMVAKQPGLTIEVLPEIDSTNTELMRRARAGQTEPTLLVAERQSAGRGRLGRTWHSAPGDSLTFSLSLPYAPQQWSGLSLAVGLSLAEALHPDIGLKWPNDLWLQGRKLGGILIEAATSAERSQLVVGVGLNIRPRPADGLSTPPAALTELWPLASAGQALARVALPLVQALQAFALGGFATLQARYAQRDVLRGREVSSSDGHSGTCLGVAADGALRGQRPLQRLDLADVAAAVGVELVQGVVGVFKRHARLRRANGANVAKVQFFGQFPLIIKGFLKQHPGVDEQHRGFRCNHRHQMQQHHRFRPEGRHQRHLPQFRVIQRMFQHRRRRMVAIARIQRRHTVRNRCLIHLKQHPAHPCRKAPF